MKADFIRQQLIDITPYRATTLQRIAGCLLLLWSVFQAEAAPSQPTYVYAVQLESSRKPNLDDYRGIRDLGTIYTYRDTNNKALTRVRIGYYNDRQTAARMLEKIKARGFLHVYITKVRNSGKIHEKAISIQPATRQNSKTYRYIIQLKSSDKPNMSDFDKVREYGNIYAQKDRSGKNLTYIRMGTYETLADARQVLDQIKTAGFHDAYIIRTRKKIPAALQQQATSPSAVKQAARTAHEESRQAGTTQQRTAPPGKPAPESTIVHQGKKAYRYTIQLESSYRPDMSDFDRVGQYGHIYTKRDTTGKKLTYIRMGTYETHAEALQVLNKVRTADFHDAYIIRTTKPVRTTEKQPPPSPAAHSASQPGKAAVKKSKPADIAGTHLYAIHITTTDDTNMDKYDPIRQFGAVYMSYRYSRQGARKDHFRVMAGYYESQPEAEAALEKIRAAGFKDARLVKVPDRSRISRNNRAGFRPATRPQPAPASTTNKRPEDASEKARQAPFIPLQQLGTDPFNTR